MLTSHGYANEGDDYVKVRLRRKEDFHFLNIDLELESAEDLKPLIEELEKDDRAWAMNLHIFEESEPFTSVTFEIGYFYKDKDFHDGYDDEKELVGALNLYLSAFCELIENLPAPAREIWDRCRRKEFDAGFESGNTTKSFRTIIEPETVRRCAALGASIGITVYPHFNYEMRAKKDLKKKKKK